VIAFHDFGWTDVLLPLQPATIIPTFVIGILIGVSYGWAVQREFPWALFVIGLAFVVVLTLGQGLTDTPGWERGIGRAGLWILLCASIIAGSEIRRLLYFWRMKRSQGEKEPEHDD
jgi:peptidoglycan/LPS O-acetylase OafA/YrhL